MAKSSRASTKKHNNRRKAVAVFAPAETARQERLSAKLLELAKQAKPELSDMKMDVADENPTEQDKEDQAAGDDTAMEVDSSAKPSKISIGRKRIDKKRSKKSSITFTKYSDRLAARKKKSAK